MAVMARPQLTMMQRVHIETDGIFRLRLGLAVFCLLLAADLFFILAHVHHFLNNRFHFSAFEFSSNFILFKDRSYSEWWEYAKTAGSSALLTAVYAKSRQPLYLALVAFFLWTLCDNAFELHEGAGRALLPLLAVAGPSVAQALGEMIFFAASALLWSILLLLAFRASVSQHRAIGWVFIALIILLAFFAVGVDALHALIRSHGEILYHVFAILEDGGELVVLSMVAAAAAATAGHCLAPAADQR